MTPTLSVASGAAPSVQSSLLLKETFRPFLPKMESGWVSSPPLATRPPAHPAQTLTRTRTSGSELVEDAGISRGLEASTGSVDLTVLLEPGIMLARSITP